MLLRTCSCYQQLAQTPSEHSLAKIPGRTGAGPPCKKPFSKYMDAEYAKMNAKLKRGNN